MGQVRGPSTLGRGMEGGYCPLLLREEECEKLLAVQGAVLGGGWREPCLRVITLFSRGGCLPLPGEVNLLTQVPELGHPSQRPCCTPSLSILLLLRLNAVMARRPLPQYQLTTSEASLSGSPQSTSSGLVCYSSRHPDTVGTALSKAYTRKLRHT